MLRKVLSRYMGFGENDKMWKTTAVFLLFFVVLFIFAITQTQHRNIEIEVGEVATSNFKAPHEIVDTDSYNMEVNEALSNMEPVYRISPTVQITSKAKVTGYMDLVRDTKLRNNLSKAEKLDELNTASPLTLNPSVHKAAIESTFSSLNTIEAISTDLLSQIMGQGIREDELRDQLNAVDGIAGSLNLKTEEEVIVSAILKETLLPNEFVDTISTERQMENIRASIVVPVIRQNDLIIQKGDIITAQQMRIIQLAELDNVKNVSWLRYIGIGILLLVPVVALLLFIQFFYPEITGGRLVYLILSSMFLTLVLGKAMGLISPFLMPSALNAILITMLVSPRLAIATNFALVWLLSFMFNIPGELASIMVIGNSVGILLLSRQNQRHRVLFNGMYMGVVSLALYLGYFFLGEITMSQLLLNGGYLLLSGLISGIIALGSLPLWENLFKVLTPIKLMELSDPNQPVLKRLFAEAPGTFHHSLIVGNLAESAAGSIGANQLLAKAGAYYHDIGKLKRPSYFKENQFGIENPHDKLEPLQSTEIIISHWEDGMRLGKESKLPREIMDIIDQHHGKTLISYFYAKASKNNDNMPEEKFRYGGEKPKSKEATIVMLADSVEAAVRSIRDMNEESIESMVRKIIRGKIDDGQLDESPITTREINVVAESFVKVLKGIYHERIEYPEKS